MEDIEVTVSDNAQAIEVTVEEQNTAINVIISDAENDPEGVSQLRSELGDIHTDLALLFKIGMDL